MTGTNGPGSPKSRFISLPSVSPRATSRASSPPDKGAHRLHPASLTYGLSGQDDVPFVGALCLLPAPRTAAWSLQREHAVLFWGMIYLASPSPPRLSAHINTHLSPLKSTFFTFPPLRMSKARLHVEPGWFSWGVITEPLLLISQSGSKIQHPGLSGIRSSPGAGPALTEW